MKKVFTNGCFDVLHRGHIEMLKYCKSLGDFLAVGIDTDFRVKQNKGEKRPINNEEDRKYVLESLRFVDKVEFFSSDTELKDLVKKYEPDYMVVGNDYENKKVIGSENAKKLIFFRRIDGYSTTKIIEKSSLNRG
jgi:D-beta-D-heptose 7-phosphate kinase/D-beta-D-heptose 1-phosphate adenosyltransferase